MNLCNERTRSIATVSGEDEEEEDEEDDEEDDDEDDDPAPPLSKCACGAPKARGTGRAAAAVTDAPPPPPAAGGGCEKRATCRGGGRGKVERGIMRVEKKV